jgi:phosphoribosyl 1,2-cyclic phosphate phosphodiesterase
MQHGTLSAMRLTFLGTGTSMGIPMIGCSCPVCLSDDPHNKRLRTSALLEIGGRALLFDAGPDLRQQALLAGIRRLDAILLTHSHADHITGLDDVRPLNFAQRSSIPLYGTDETLAAVRERFSYAFTEGSQGSTRPAIELVPIVNGQPFSIDGIEILPLAVQHGTWTITGFRVGRLGYVTDASALSAATMDALQGLDLLVLNVLRPQPHPTHFTVAEGLAVVAQLRPRRALFVHMAHDLEHHATNAHLPPEARLAYDGQVVEIAP